MNGNNNFLEKLVSLLSQYYVSLILYFIVFKYSSSGISHISYISTSIGCIIHVRKLIYSKSVNLFFQFLFQINISDDPQCHLQQCQSPHISFSQYNWSEILSNIYFWHTSMNVTKPNVFVFAWMNFIINNFKEVVYLSYSILRWYRLNSSKIRCHQQLADASLQVCHLKSLEQHHIVTIAFSSNSSLRASLPHWLHFQFQKLPNWNRHLALIFLSSLYCLTDVSTSLKTGYIFGHLVLSMNNPVQKKHFRFSSFNSRFTCPS